MKKISLTQGFEAMVDDEDFERLNQHRWFAQRDRKNRDAVYATRLPTAKGRRTSILMHRQILNAPLGSEIDHIDHDSLNNQKANIRITNRRSNLGNQKLAYTNSSGYKGVCWHRQNKRWYAQMQINGKLKHLGSFDTALEAALAYDAAVLKYRDEHATTNKSLGLLS